MIIYTNIIEDKCFLYNKNTGSMLYVSICLEQNIFLDLREINIMDWAPSWSSHKSILFIPEKYKNYTNKLYIDRLWSITYVIPDEIKQYMLFM